MILDAKAMGPLVRTYLWIERAVEANITEEVARKVKEVSGREEISEAMVDMDGAIGLRKWDGGRPVVFILK